MKVKPKKTRVTFESLDHGQVFRCPVSGQCCMKCQDNTAVVVESGILLYSPKSIWEVIPVDGTFVEE